MNINATILGQMITFAILVGVTMRYIWPPVMKALAERQEKIAAGLQAAAEGERQLEEAREKVLEQRKQMKQDAQAVLKEANETGARLVAEAREKATQEGRRLLAQAQEEIRQEKQKAKEALMKEVAGLVIGCTDKLLQTKIDEAASNQLIERFIVELEEG